MRTTYHYSLFILIREKHINAFKTKAMHYKHQTINYISIEWGNGHIKKVETGKKSTKDKTTQMVYQRES